MLSERYEVALNFAEVYLPSATSFREVRVIVRVAEKVLELVLSSKPQGQMIIYGLKPNTNFEFILYADETLVGTSTVFMAALNPDGVEGTNETWVKIETNAVGMDSSPTKAPAYMRTYSEVGTNLQSPTKRFARLRLGVAVRNTAKKSTEPSSPSKLKEFIQCPFLAKIASANHDDVEAFDTYKKVKAEVMEKLQDADRPVTTQVSVKVIDLPGEYFDIDIPNLDGFNFSSLTGNDGEALRNIIVGLSHRINVLRADHEELGLLREQLDKSNRARAELQDSIQETTESLQRESMSTAGTLKQLEDERHESLLQMTAMAKDLQKVQHDKAILEHEKAELAREVLELRARSASARDLQDQINSLKQLQAEQERKDREFQGKKDKEAKEFSDFVAASIEERRRINAEKDDLLKALVQKDSEFESLKIEIDSLQLDLQAANLTAKEAAEAKKGQENVAAIKAEAAELKAKVLKQLEDFANKEAAIAIEGVEMQNQLIADKQNVADHMEFVESELETAQKKLHELKRQLLEQKSQVATLEELVCIREDSKSVTEELQQQLNIHRSSKDEALSGLKSLSEYTLAQAQRAKEHVQMLQKFSAAVEERDDEIDQLKHMVVVIKNRNPMYVPVKGDLVDETLAEYLNNRTEPIPIPFYRQDLEVYIFGTKRIFVKLDCGRIAIRVGGGFMQIDDFLEIYTKQELEKMEARDSRNSPAKARKLLGKIAEAQIGDRNMSPLKAAKIIAGAIEQSYTTCFGVKDKSPVRSSGSKSPMKRNTLRTAVQASPSTMAGSPNKKS